MFQPITHGIGRRYRTVLIRLLTLCIGTSLVFNSVQAETWVCPRQGQPDLYTDREYPGCRQLGEPRTYSPLEITPSSRSAPPSRVRPSEPHAESHDGSFGVASHEQTSARKPLPFPEVSLSIPVLAVGQAKAGVITGSWIGLLAHLTVAYKADGKGPEILGDSNLLGTAIPSFYTAVAVASKAVGYDPRYLSVRILVPTKLEGPSAGGIYAVGIAAALLGDPIRQDICMSGTIEADGQIQAVGRLVDKMSACRDLRKTTMIVPDALDNSHLSFTGAERSIQVVEVHTLAEAYSAATGQGLRQVP